MKNAIKKSELTIPKEVISKLSSEITLHSFDSVIVMKNTHMTALDIVNTIESLEHIIVDLYDALIEEFPQDEYCEDCNYCVGIIEDEIEVPNWAKHAVGVDLDTKFEIIAEEKSGRILLEPVEYLNDLRDISENMKEQLSNMGVCLGELNESLIQGDIVYEG